MPLDLTPWQSQKNPNSQRSLDLFLVLHILLYQPHHTMHRAHPSNLQNATFLEKMYWPHVLRTTHSKIFKPHAPQM